jgi:hypothetical protein
MLHAFMRHARPSEGSAPGSGLPAPCASAYLLLFFFFFLCFKQLCNDAIFSLFIAENIIKLP